MTIDSKHKFLLISSPRSGSTLLANMIRSHPEVSFYNELFTRAPALLPRLEEAFQNGDSDLKTPFEQDLYQLKRYKFEGLGNILHRARVTKFPFLLFHKVMASLLNRISTEQNKWNYFRKVYYINGLHEPPFKPFYHTQFPKASRIRYWFFKDVRMPKALPVFNQAYPEGKIIYLKRDPYQVIASEIKHRHLKSMEDLKYIQKTFLRDRFHRPDLVEQYFGQSVEHTLALSWRLENEMVEQRLKQLPDDQYKVVTYEQLINEKADLIKKLFQWLELDFANQSNSFIKLLDVSAGNQKHSRATIANKKREQKNGLTRTQTKNVQAVLEGSELMETLQ